MAVEMRFNVNPSVTMNGEAYGLKGDTGTTFTPSVSEEGIISWTNDGGKQNPEPVNIKGPQGERGEIPDETPSRSVIDLIVERAFIREEIETAGKSLETTTMCRAFVNNTDTTDDYGIQSNTVVTSFSGGNATAFATAIKPTIPNGMQTYGNLTCEVDGETIYVNRITKTYITATVTLIPGTGYDNTIKSAIKQAIVDFTNSLCIGEKLNASELIEECVKVSGGTCNIISIILTNAGRNTDSLDGDITKLWLIKAENVIIAEV